MNAPAETAPAPATNPAYLRVLEALVSLNEPADRERIATKADISPDGAGVQLVALAGKRIVVHCPQPKGAPALWSLAVSLSTVRQMVEGMKRAAAEASPAADDRRRIIAAMREIGAPASAFAIAKKSGVDLSVVSVMLEAMTADGTVQRIPGSTGQRPKFALIPSVQPQTPAATDGEPGDGTPDEDHEDEETAACADPDDFRDGDDRPTVADDAYGLDYDPRVAEAEAAAYDALVEAEAAADEAPLAGEDVNSGEDVIGDWCERHADPAEAAAEQIAAAVAAGHCPTVALLIQRASPVAEEAAQRAIDDAEVEALMREEEAEIALEMARDARVRGRAAAELIRFAEQRTGLAGDADPSAVLYAIDELLGQAREAVTGMSLPA